MRPLEPIKITAHKLTADAAAAAAVAVTSHDDSAVVDHHANAADDDDDEEEEEIVLAGSEALPVVVEAPIKLKLSVPKITISLPPSAPVPAEQAAPVTIQPAKQKPSKRKVEYRDDVEDEVDADGDFNNDEDDDDDEYDVKEDDGGDWKPKQSSHSKSKKRAKQDKPPKIKPESVVSEQCVL